MVTAEITHGDLRVQLETIQRGEIAVYLAKAWSGKARNPFAYFSYRSEAQRDARVEDWKRSEDARRESKARRKLEIAQAKDKAREEIQVGTVLVYSWGYEQTNVDFFVVVERTGKASCVVQRCGSITVPGSDGNMGMSARVRPDPSRLIGERMRKVIGSWGVSMGHGTARPCEPNSSHYCSWYA